MTYCLHSCLIYKQFKRKIQILSVVTKLQWNSFNTIWELDSKLSFIYFISQVWHEKYVQQNKVLSGVLNYHMKELQVVLWSTHCPSALIVTPISFTSSNFPPSITSFPPPTMQSHLLKSEVLGREEETTPGNCVCLGAENLLNRSVESCLCNDSLYVTANCCLFPFRQLYFYLS